MTATRHIEMRGVSKAFRYFTLQDLSFDLEPGQVMGFVGPNGAGKTTTIRLAMGMMTADVGEVRVLGCRMPDEQAFAKRDIGFVSADMRLVPNATLGWHMKLVSSIYPGWDAEYAATLLKRFNLRTGQIARTLSHGEHIKAALLLALARRPRLLILDEPTTGLDPVARQEMLTEFMDVLRDERRSILLVEYLERGKPEVARGLAAALDTGRLPLPGGFQGSLEHSLVFLTSGLCARELLEEVPRIGFHGTAPEEDEEHDRVHESARESPVEAVDLEQGQEQCGADPGRRPPRRVLADDQEDQPARQRHQADSEELTEGDRIDHLAGEPEDRLVALRVARRVPEFRRQRIVE